MLVTPNPEFGFLREGLPIRFGSDKRRLNLSSLIVSSQMTRDEALTELSKPIATPEQMRRDIKIVAKKIGLGAAECDELNDSPSISHLDYPNEMAHHSGLSTIKTAFRRVAFWHRMETPSA